jgi:predicted amidohydrolase
MSELTVAAVQTDPRFGDVTGNLEAALALVPPGCDLAVLPELCTTGYQFVSLEEALSLAEPVPEGPSCRRLLAFAAERRVTVVAGLAELVRTPEGARCHNSAVLCRPDGTWGLYRKVHLFWDEKSWFAPGDLGFPVFRACGTTLGLMICFDWIFPEAARSLALAGAAVICHPSNLVLPHCPDAMITRCLENRVFAVTANRVGEESRAGQTLRFIGQSQVVSPRGEVLAACAGAGAGAAVARIDPAAADKRVTPRNDLFADRRPESYHL